MRNTDTLSWSRKSATIEISSLFTLVTTSLSTSKWRASPYYVSSSIYSNLWTCKWCALMMRGSAMDGSMKRSMNRAAMYPRSSFRGKVPSRSNITRTKVRSWELKSCMKKRSVIARIHSWIMQRSWSVICLYETKVSTGACESSC